MHRHWPLGLILALAPASHGLAQDRPAGLRAGDSSVEGTAGFSWFSPGGTLGDVTHRRVYVTSIRAAAVVATSDRFAIAYTVELVPLAVIERTHPNGRTCWSTASGQDSAVTCKRDRSARVAAGAGASPFGFRTYLNRSGRWRAHGGGSAGLMVFTSDVPIDNSRKLNFTFEYGAGVELATRAGRAITLGYKFQHISNAGIGYFNPGLDANVIYFGLVKSRTPK